MCLSKSLGGLCTFKWDNRCDHFVGGDVLLESLWVPKGPQSGSKWLMMVYSTQEKCVRFIWSFSVHHLRPLDNFIQWNPEFWHFWLASLPERASCNGKRAKDCDLWCQSSLHICDCRNDWSLKMTTTSSGWKILWLAPPFFQNPIHAT